MIPELIGRFATISVLHELSREDLRHIVGGGIAHSPLHTQQELARLHGIHLTLTDDALDAIADEAVALGTGARALHRLVGRAVDAVDYRWPELAASGVTAVVIDRECAVSNGEPEMIVGPARSRNDRELRRRALSGLPPRPRPVLASAAASGPAFTDARELSDEEIWNAVEAVKRGSLGWGETTDSARTWWATFEKENQHRPALVLRLVEELQHRGATINEFFLTYVYSNTDNIQANLHYLDYSRLKKQSEES
jgi:hypothetical protein